MRLIDENERREKLLKLAITVVVATAILSQIMLQLGEGSRNDELNFTDQLDEFDQPMTFEEGLPPFISSAGVYAPESIVFGIGFTISGILFILLAYEMGICNRIILSRHESTKIHIFSNNIGMLVGMFTGVSLALIAWTPMHTQLIAHIALALQIFYGGMIWAALVTISRVKVDSNERLNNIPITPLRWGLIATAFISLQLSSVAIANHSFDLAAVFEWVLFFAQVGVLYTFQTSFKPHHDSEEE
ncbi:MAG: hypothetical protein HOE69_04430 [Euryarchaeota archaeon]|jgi:hypothetical protein|nr:hypothetical protein [Euryarchaeota archaeon]